MTLYMIYDIFLSNLKEQSNWNWNIPIKCQKFVYRTSSLPPRRFPEAFYGILEPALKGPQDFPEN